MTGATQNDNTAFNSANYPASPEVRYYLAFEKGGTEYGRSYEFGVSHAGAHEFNSYIFPSSGSWTVNLRKVSDNSSVATAAVTVAAA